MKGAQPRNTSVMLCLSILCYLVLSGSFYRLHVAKPESTERM